MVHHFPVGAPGDDPRRRRPDITLARKIRLKPVYLEGLFCKEIDYLEDLEEVRKYTRGTK